MSLIISLIAAVVFAVVFAKPLQKVPWLFYVLAIALCAAAIYFFYDQSQNAVLRNIIYAMQKARVAFALFTVVMFIGVFEHRSAIRRYLNPARAPLSIIAAILIIPHFVPYLTNYISLLADILMLPPTVVSSLAISMVLLVLLAILTILSFNFVRKRMSSVAWKRIQRFSYLFFALVFIHMLGYLITPALGGSSKAIFTLMIYVPVFLLYVVLRVRRARLDRAQQIPQDNISEGG